MSPFLGRVFLPSIFLEFAVYIFPLQNRHTELLNPLNVKRKSILVLDKQIGFLKPVLLIIGVKALQHLGIQDSISLTSTNSAPTPVQML